MQASDGEFVRTVLPLCEQLFPEGELLVQTRSSGDPIDDAAVRVTHIPSGQVVTSEDYGTQLHNKLYALLILRLLLDESDAPESKWRIRMICDLIPAPIRWPSAHGAGSDQLTPFVARSAGVNVPITARP